MFIVFVHFFLRQTISGNWCLNSCCWDFSTWFMFLAWFFFLNLIFCDHVFYPHITADCSSYKNNINLELNLYPNRTRLKLTLTWQFFPLWVADFFRETSSSTSDFRFCVHRVMSEEGHKHDLNSTTAKMEVGCRGGSQSEEICRPWWTKLPGQCQF